MEHRTRQAAMRTRCGDREGGRWRVPPSLGQAPTGFETSSPFHHSHARIRAGRRTATERLDRPGAIRAMCAIGRSDRHDSPLLALGDFRSHVNQLSIPIDVAEPEVEELAASHARIESGDDEHVDQRIARCQQPPLFFQRHTPDASVVFAFELDQRLAAAAKRSLPTFLEHGEPLFDFVGRRNSRSFTYRSRYTSANASNDTTFAGSWSKRPARTVDTERHSCAHRACRSSHSSIPTVLRRIARHCELGGCPEDLRGACEVHSIGSDRGWTACDLDIRRRSHKYCNVEICIFRRLPVASSMRVTVVVRLPSTLNMSGFRATLQRPLE